MAKMIPVKCPTFYWDHFPGGMREAIGKVNGIVLASYGRTTQYRQGMDTTKQQLKTISDGRSAEDTNMTAVGPATIRPRRSIEAMG